MNIVLNKKKILCLLFNFIHHLITILLIFFSNKNVCYNFIGFVIISYLPKFVYLKQTVNYSFDVFQPHTYITHRKLTSTTSLFKPSKSMLSGRNIIPMVFPLLVQTFMFPCRFWRHRSMII